MLRGAAITQWRPADSTVFRAGWVLPPRYSLKHSIHDMDSVTTTSPSLWEDRTQRSSKYFYIHSHTQSCTHTYTHNILIYSWVWSCRGWQDHCWLDWNAAEVCCSPHLTNTHTHTHTHRKRKREQYLKGTHSNWLDLQLFFFRCRSITEWCTGFLSHTHISSNHTDTHSHTHTHTNTQTHKHTNTCHIPLLVFKWCYGNINYGNFGLWHAFCKTNDGTQGTRPQCVTNNIPLRPWRHVCLLECVCVWVFHIIYFIKN